MDNRTRYEDMTEAVDSAISSRLAEVQTALPCTVVSVDFAKQTCVLQPTVKARVRKADGTSEWIRYPQLVDVPLHFPTGGGVTMTFPVKEGDEALAIMSSRTPDTWQQQGGEQQMVDGRSHDLSSAFAMVGFKNEGAALSGVSDNSTQIRSTDGKTVIDLKPGSGLTFTQGGVSMAMTESGVEFTGGTLKHNGKNIGDTHVHGGIVPGGSDTSTPH